MVSMASGTWCPIVLIVVSLYAVSCENSTDITPRLKCYQCNSGESFQGKKCLAEEGPKDLTDFLHECVAEEGRPAYTRCRKQVQTVENEMRIIRSCATAGTSGSQERCIDRVGTARVKVKYCECNNDKDKLDEGCNSAYLATSSVTSFILGLAAAAMLWGRV